MAYICEKELLDIYSEIKPKLESIGLRTGIDLIRDYLLKIEIYQGENLAGKLIIDYSPKKKRCGLRKDGSLNEELFAQILSVIEDNNLPAVETRKKQPILNQSIKSELHSIRYHAYVDGSYIDGRVGYGAVILDNGNIVAEMSGAVDDPEAQSSRQVGGELKAVIEVLEWCRFNGIDSIAIFYDFENIEKWAVGKYKTNTPMTQAYKRYIDNCGIDISWVKVDSHTGVALNDRADELAKKGARESSTQDMPSKVNSKTNLSGWIIYNASLMTPKFMEQVDWFIKAAQDEGILLKPFRNDEIAVAIIEGRLALTKHFEQKPDFVIFWDKDVRLARQLERLGLKLFNPYKAIFACDDKILTHQILADKGIPMPKTIVSPLVYPGTQIDEAGFIDTIEEFLSYPMVVKEAFGSFGAQVYLAHDRDELLSLRKKLIYVPHLYQEFITSSKGRDVRLQVVGDEVVAAIIRTSDNDFRANLTAGGRMASFIPPQEYNELAVKAAKLVGAHFAGVDILFGKDDKPIICEINSNAHMKNIYDCTGVDVAKKIIEYIKGTI